MAETQRDTLNAEMQIARSNIEDVGIAIGGDLLPMVSTLTGYISTAAARFQDLDEGQRKTIIAAAGCRSGARSCVARRRDSSTVDSRPSGAYGVPRGGLNGRRCEHGRARPHCSQRT